jgi:hypothetical protein
VYEQLAAGRLCVAPQLDTPGARAS